MKRTAIWLTLLCAVIGVGALHACWTRYPLDFVGGAHKPILVATRDLAPGELIARPALDFRDLPARYLDERHISGDELERVLGTRVTGAVHSGSALLWTDLDVSPERRTLASLVKAGMRAFSLRERDVTFEGLLRPGDRADVLFTSTDTQPSTPTVMLVQNALVLTVGADLGAELGAELEPAGKRAGPADRVTLSVTIEQALRLAQCEGRGALRLALRNPYDLVPAQGPSSELARAAR